MSDGSILVLQIGVLIGGVFIIYLFYRYFCMLRFDKKLSRYTIDFIKDEDSSFTAKLLVSYHYLCHSFATRLDKYSIFHSYAEKYQKYISSNHYAAIDIISTKFIVGAFSFFFVLITSSFSSFDFWGSVMALIVGFFIPDVYLVFKRKKIKNEINNDLLRVLTIMNHSFQSGNSIMQAIKTVSEEMEGPLEKEFKKMYLDLTFGLDLETVFNRFYQRVPLEEIHYITTSLLVLNKTGGNIITIFQMIEKNYYTRQKLNQELKMTTASSALVFKILVCMPVLMVFTILLLNSEYFKLLFTTKFGFLISGIIMLLYFGYIIAVRKIIRIDR